ncbi:sensor histidine kinase [Cryobacterium adonitolivorans]|uniref:Oxygen sensor histidine kinase NreB n=1 Tax=Cryobacterium adonitolivorans TaxID=1259189 RepID=A0A4R8W4G4_9MICO|nr:sensor histidine kinase [Cryobacterium adonitolivorans]TFC02408.1 sensor histidine kinase [Cryobacterium adonitolivorans]
MNARRWWDLIVTGSLIVLVLMAADNSGSGPVARTGGVLSLATIGIGYLVWGRRMLRSPDASGSAGDSGFDHEAFPVSARLFQITLIVACGAATAFDPSLATAQTVAFPILWALARSFSGAVVLSALLSLSAGLGLWIGMWGTADAAVQATAIEAISFVFALAMGTWITRIADAGAAQRRLVEKLTAAQEELAVLHRDAGSSAERERLAREIHDTIAQSLTSLVMLTQRGRSELAALPGDTSAVADSLDLIESTGRDALTEARALVASMSPVRAADGDLAHTVTRLAERFERETGIQVTLDLTSLDLGAHPPLNRALEVVLLRCGQEALANVRKHSRAGAARLTVDRTYNEVTLTVTDNGQGLGDYSPESENGFGLAGMRDRVSLVGGRLEVANAANGTGTVLRVTLPVQVLPLPALPVPAQAVNAGGHG